MVRFDICENNPGAMTFLADAYMTGHPGLAERAFQRMQDNGIRGDKLYMIWNDCCGRNTAKAVKIMATKPIEDIIRHINYEQGRGIPYEEGEV